MCFSYFDYKREKKKKLPQIKSVNGLIQRVNKPFIEADKGE